MSAGIKFMIISHEHEQLINLKRYIRSLYERAYDNSNCINCMAGGDMSVSSYNNLYILTGTHYGCFGYNLGYWCNHDNCNHLLQDVIYLEDTEDDGYVFQYSSAVPESEYGLLDSSQQLCSIDEDEIVNMPKDFPTDLLPVIQRYFAHGII